MQRWAGKLAAQEICVCQNTLTCLDATHNVYEPPESDLKDMPGNFFRSTVSASKYAMKNRRPNTFGCSSCCVQFFILWRVDDQRTTYIIYCIYMCVCKVAVALSATGVQHFMHKHTRAKGSVLCVCWSFEKNMSH